MSYLDLPVPGADTIDTDATFDALVGSIATTRGKSLTFRNTTTDRTTLVEEVLVTPELAQKWLDANNIDNRHQRDPAVKTYARLMRDGLWGFDTNAIAFDYQGRLRNGQHRLSAVVESGTSQYFLVMTGLGLTAHLNIDAGIVRTAVDDQKQAGLDKAGYASSITRTLLGLKNRTLFSSRVRYARVEVSGFIGQHSQAVTEAADMAHVLKRSLGITPAAAGAAYFMCAEVDRAAANIFFTRLADGLNMDADSPIYVLRNQLGTPAGRKPKPAETYSLLIQGWNAWRKGEKRDRFQQPRGGLNEKSMPQP